MKHGRSRAFQPGVECLEDRSLMAAHLNATLSAGLLRVDGTPGADHIVIRQQGNRISVDNISINIRGQGNVSSVSASQVKRIDVRGLEGNDIIEVGGDETHGSNALVKPVWIGAGNDRIYGSQGDDKIHADAGNDQVYGRGGNDTIDGDAGNDKLDGGDGNDTLRGGDGYDSLWGGAGNDKLDGGTGNDQLWGGAGNDQLNGGVGSNHLLGEAGDDVINSNSHHDTIDGGAGRNLIYFLAGTPTPSSAGATARSSAAVSTPSAPSGPFAADVNELIARTNAYRASKRLPTLTVDARLTKAAQYQADYMARTGHYDHVNLDGRALENRVQATGYRYSLIAENIHLYDPAVRRTLGLSRIFSLNELAEYYLDGWIVSPGHNANLLLKTVKNVGVGIAQDRNGLVYVSMVLGQH